MPLIEFFRFVQTVAAFTLSLKRDAKKHTPLAEISPGNGYAWLDSQWTPSEWEYSSDCYRNFGWNKTAGMIDHVSKRLWRRRKQRIV